MINNLRLKFLNLFSLVIIFVNPSPIYSQDNLTQDSKFSYGINYSQDLCYRRLVNNENDPTNSVAVDDLIENRNKYEFLKLGYTFGALIRYNSNKKWAWESGLQILSLGYASSASMTVSPNQVDPTKGFVKPTPDSNGKPISKFKWVYTHNYLSVPIRICYSQGFRKLRFVSSAGVSAGFLLCSTFRTHTKYVDGSKDKGKATKQNEKYNTLNVFLNLGIGASYQIKENIHIHLESKINYGALKINNYPLTAYLWNSGLAASLYFTLPK